MTAEAGILDCGFPCPTPNGVGDGDGFEEDAQNFICNNNNYKKKKKKKRKEEKKRRKKWFPLW